MKGFVYLLLVYILCTEVGAVGVETRLKHWRRPVTPPLTPPGAAPLAPVSKPLYVEAQLEGGRDDQDASVTDSPPSPPTSFADFDISGKLEGDYDPFSQVRHVVDGVFRQHEEALKQGRPLPPSSFVEVQSFISHSSSPSSSSSSAPSGVLTPLLSSAPSSQPPPSSSLKHKPSLADSSSSSSSSSPSFRVRFHSATVMSQRLGAVEMPTDFQWAMLEDESGVVVADRQHNQQHAFLEMSSKVSTVHSFCEICILAMQMKERGEPHICAGLNANYYVTCVEVLESILRADKALVYWLKEGCMHLDSEGPEIVRPCPAINVCSWVPNLFTPPPTIVVDEVEALCPKDLRFLPTIPEEYRALLG